MQFDHQQDIIDPDITEVLTIKGSGGLELPAGTDQQRPSSIGILRYNTTADSLEWSTANGWKQPITSVVTGYTGSQGTQGPIGYVGSQGVVGYTGSQGIIGYTGSAGAIGATGFTGSAGLGSTGYTGSQGVIGYTGSAGSNYLATALQTINNGDLTNGQYTFNSNYDILFVDTNVATTIILPTSLTGRIIMIKHIGTTTSLTVQPQNNGTIDGETSKISTTRYTNVLLVSTGSDVWHIL